MKLPQTEIYYEEDLEHIEVDESECNFTVRIGFSPETKMYYIVRDKDPWFCFEGADRDKVLDKATSALEFYVEHGLTANG